MAEFLASGHLADLVLIVMVAEAVGLFVLMRRGVIALPFRIYLAGVIAGACLVLALRQALTGANPYGIALALALSFVAHLVEIFAFLRCDKGDPIRRNPSYNDGSAKGIPAKKGK